MHPVAVREPINPGCETDVMEEVSGSRVIGDWAVSLAGEISTACANLAAGVLLARAAGPEGKGAFTLAMTVAALSAAVLGLRWDRPAGHFLARQATAFPTVLTSVAVVAGLAMGLAAITLAHSPAWFIQLLLRGLDPSVITLIAWLVGAQCLYLGIAALHGGMRQFAARSRFILIYNLLQAAIVGTLYVLGVRAVVNYLRCCVAGSWAIELFWLAKLAWRYRVRPRWDWSLIRSMASFGSRSYPSLLLDLVTVRLDLILLNIFASTAAVGVYSVAVAIGARLASIPQMVAYVVFHRTSARELGSGGKTAQILRLAALALCCGAIVVIFAGSLLIVPLYGPGFALAVPTLRIMVPAMGVWGLYRLLASDVEGRGRPGLVSLSSVAANMTIVALDVLWIPKYGVVGAAWASLAAYSVALVFMALTFCHVTRLSFRDAYRYRAEDLGAMARMANRLARQAGLVSNVV